MTPRRPRPPRYALTIPRVLPTRAGWAALAVALAIGLAGANSGVNVLFLMSGVVAGAFLVSFFSAWRQLSGVDVVRRLPASVHAGQPFVVDLTLTNRKPRPAHALLVEDLAQGATEPWHAFAPRVAARTRSELRYHSRVMQRGLVHFRGIRLSTLFPFGLVRASMILPGGEQNELVVYPALGDVRPSFLQGQLMGVRERASLQPSRIGATDIHGLREYRTGDNPKWIHWRTSARLGKPLVKEFDREEARRVHVVIDTVLENPADDVARLRLERVISFAATLASASTRATREIGLTALSKDRIDLAPASGVGQVRAVLTALARLAPPRHAPPPVPALERHTFRNTAVIVVVLTAERLRDLPLAAWQAPGATVRVVDASGAAFDDLFTPPALLGGPTYAGPVHRAPAAKDPSPSQGEGRVRVGPASEIEAAPLTLPSPRRGEGLPPGTAANDPKGGA